MWFALRLSLLVSFLFFFSFLVAVGFEFRALYLLGKHALSHELCLQPFFALIIFQMGSCIFAQLSLARHIPIKASYIDGTTGKQKLQHPAY
jgi:hypothetical protein